MKYIALLLPLMALSCSNAPVATQPATAGEYRYSVDYVHDGDTVYITMHELPPELQKIGIRVRGIDTPEINGKCQREKDLAQQAKQVTYDLLRQNNAVIYVRNIKWDKFGGRVDGDVLVGEGRTPLARTLIQQGLAMPYQGGRRDPMRWCK